MEEKSIFEIFEKTNRKSRMEVVDVNRRNGEEG